MKCQVSGDDKRCFIYAYTCFYDSFLLEIGILISIKAFTASVKLD